MGTVCPRGQNSRPNRKFRGQRTRRIEGEIKGKMAELRSIVKDGVKELPIVHWERERGGVVTGNQNEGAGGRRAGGSASEAVG